MKKSFILWPNTWVQGKYPVYTCRKINPVCLFFVVVVCVYFYYYYSCSATFRMKTCSQILPPRPKSFDPSHLTGRFMTLIHLEFIFWKSCRAFMRKRKEKEEGGKGSPNVADTTSWLFRKLFSGACSSLSNSLPNMKNIYLRRNQEIVVNYGIKQRGMFTPSQYFIY